MSEIGEFELIGRIVAQIRDSVAQEGVTGIGDDCAVIPQREGLDTLVSTDLLIEGRHFLLDDISPYELGWKSAAVNISDIAAMGGRPTAAFLSIALPSGLAERLSSVAVFPESVASLPLPQVGPSRSKPRAAMLSEETAPHDNRSAGEEGIGYAPEAFVTPSGKVSEYASEAFGFPSTAIEPGVVPEATRYPSSGMMPGFPPGAAGPSFLGKMPGFPPGAAGPSFSGKMPGFPPGAAGPFLSGKVSCLTPETAGSFFSGNEEPSIFPEAGEGGDSRPSTDEGLWIDWFIKGFNDVCRRYGVALLGGDTSASPSELFINVTVMGECAHGTALRRDGARPGDLICVTGPLGDSATGLKLILERAAAGVLPVRPTMGGPASKSAQNAPGPPTFGRTGSTCPPQMRSGVQASAPGTSFSAQNAVEGPSQCTPDRIFSGGEAAKAEAEAALIRRHYLPEPRVEMGEVLAATAGVHAMMDISDGIASDLRHILKASRVGATIDVNKLPISSEMRLVCEARGWDQAELAVGGGEDYELLFTAAPGTALPEGCIPIGIIDAEPGLRWLGGRKEYKGFTHF